jgi:hypothetical protein
LGEFLLPYDAVRRSSDPEATLMAFLESTYGIAADLGGWDRAALECPAGVPGRPRPMRTDRADRARAEGGPAENEPIRSRGIRTGEDR